MNLVLQLNILLTLNLLCHSDSIGSEKSDSSYRELTDHTMVTDNGIFPFVAAILSKSAYVSAGALINEFWVITAADSLFLIRETTRIMRVRLGSVNNKKGGYLSPVKTIEIHPSFDDNSAAYDIALILLPTRVRFTPSVYPIQLQTQLQEVSTTHFMVNSWPPHVVPSSVYPNHTESLDIIKRRRMMTVSHLHPSSKENCSDLIQFLNVTEKETMMCLDPAVGTDPCERDVGAPVVLNGILWGILSSWKPDDCDTDPGPMLVTLVAAKNVSSWLHSTMRGHIWSINNTVDYENYYYEDDSEK
ncbi:hypodermin-A-like [Plodia interpunctella]|uniref:hypodermin-A-like n=1 Tax=Plodia interpunctella TaxID=58824 RepID=UPI002368BB38|nr:hypodermin-A-like [Plodia interpunctella]XP_053618482.1 hypodermin-A-like [Plodia interpunctella]XP_053618483.1 hypodermin-A-like [Plodia interpunctella]